MDEGHEHQSHEDMDLRARLAHLGESLEEVMHVLAETLTNQDVDTYDFEAISKSLAQFHLCHFDAAMYLLYLLSTHDGQTCHSIRSLIPRVRASIEQAELA